MIILGIDSSTDNLSVGLADDRRILGEKLLKSRREHASLIIGTIDDVISVSSRLRTELDGIGISIGPGSFTGLRIGLAVAKGLALALDIPIVGISTFEVIADRLRGEFQSFCLAAPARKGEYYLCRVEPESAVRESFSLVEESDLPDAVGGDLLGVIGEDHGGVAQSLKKIIPPEKLYISGGELAKLALTRLAQGLSDSVVELEPMYIAPSQAERKFGRK